jgi:hypothetical protein
MQLGNYAALQILRGIACWFNVLALQFFKGPNYSADRGRKSETK